MNNIPITRASFNLTQRCNLRCTYPCFTYGCGNKDMHPEVAKRGIDFLLNNALQTTPPSVVEIGFWGGEPLLKFDLLKEMVWYAEPRARALNIPLQFSGTTNGTLLTPDKFDFLDEKNIFFMVSLDGTEETHDYHRKMVDGSGSHKLVVKNFKEALKRWPFYRARISVSADRVDHFFEDIVYIFELGCNDVMFSPVYESKFTDEKWAILEEQCYKVVDYMVQKRKEGRILDVSHFSSYAKPDDSIWPCGAGRMYVHINHEGFIFTCHRAEKFNDPRPYLERELCIGDIFNGIVKPEVRQKFIDYNPKCRQSECFKDSPCHGGCYSVNFDMTGQVDGIYEGICKYTAMQKRVSAYYASKVPEILQPATNRGGSCVCNYTFYSGPVERDIGIWTHDEKYLLKVIIQDIDKRLQRLERIINDASEQTTKVI